MRIFELITLLVWAAGSAMAAEVAPVPEIDSASALGALTLLSGALLVIRTRGRRDR